MNKLYSKFLGLNTVDNVTSTDSVSRDTANSIAFSIAKNVDMLKTYKFQRRDGYDTKILSGNYRSIWSDGNVVLAVKGSNLIRVYTDGAYTEEILKLNVGDYDMSYANFGNRIYYANPITIGYIENGAAYNLPTATTTYKDVFMDGDIIEIYKSILYVVKGKYLYNSDAVDLNQYDGRKGIIFQFKSNGMLCKAVDDGIYIADEDNTYFLQGAGPNKFITKHIVNYGAKKGAVTRIGKTVIIEDQFYEDAIMWTSTKGICIGGNGGWFRNLTESIYIMPACFKGTSAYLQRDGLNQYITILQ